MDLRVGASGIHLPPELLDIIVGFLAEDRQSLLNARLACKALHACTTKKLISRPSQPSEILTKGTLEVDDKALAAIRPIKSSPNAVTVWTWLRLPCKAGASRSLDKEFEHLLRAPSEAPYGERKDARGGRVATCWARMREDPELVAVVMRRLSFESPTLQSRETLTHVQSSRTRKHCTNTGPAATPPPSATTLSVSHQAACNRPLVPAGSYAVPTATNTNSRAGH